MKIQFPRSVLNDVSEATSREWLETNGVGGWASATVAGTLSRRYHGLLVAAMEPPLKRYVMLSKIDEAVLLGDQRIELGTNQYPGVFAPQGFLRLSSFEQELFPVTRFEAAGISMQRTVAAIHGSNTTVLIYDILDSPAPFTMELKPFVAGRDYHSLRRANHALQQFWSWKDGVFSFQPYPDSPHLNIALAPTDPQPSAAPSVFFEQRPDWYHNFEYAAERQRGYDYQEDLFTPGNFLASVSKGDTLVVVASTDPIDPSFRERAGDWGRTLVERERQRRRALIGKSPSPKPLAQRLTLAADQFIVRRGMNGRTVVAGYHWFGDWGRDTMISLPGLTLATKRYDDAQLILSTFCRHIKNGLIPNRFRDEDGSPEYNTVDASLWFCQAVSEYDRHTSDTTFVRSVLYPAVLQVLTAYAAGTEYGIRADTDGLLTAGGPHIQLTWMDAKIGDWVVTPRHGKAVEIQALWYNALLTGSALARKFGDDVQTKQFSELAEHVRKSFESTFWIPELGYLADCITDGQQDRSLRPNQIYAISLPQPLLRKEHAESVLAVVERKLLTPVGLRSLDPDHPSYQPFYRGEPAARDGQYHQGTVWGFLLGGYLLALLRYRGASGTVQARRIAQKLEEQLGSAGLGSLSEIYDGNEPHTPRGCIAQAWSVAEILRVLAEYPNLLD